MRNLAEYPITNEEIMREMNNAVVDADNPFIIPNMRHVLLSIARDIVARGLRDEKAPKPVERAHMHRRINDKGAHGTA